MNTFYYPVILMYLLFLNVGQLFTFLRFTVRTSIHSSTQKYTQGLCLFTLSILISYEYNLLRSLYIESKKQKKNYFTLGFISDNLIKTLTITSIINLIEFLDFVRRIDKSYIFVFFFYAILRLIPQVFVYLYTRVYFDAGLVVIEAISISEACLLLVIFSSIRYFCFSVYKSTEYEDYKETTDIAEIFSQNTSFLDHSLSGFQRQFLIEKLKSVAWKFCLCCFLEILGRITYIVMLTNVYSPYIKIFNDFGSIVKIKYIYNLFDSIASISFLEVYIRRKNQKKHPFELGKFLLFSPGNPDIDDSSQKINDSESCISTLDI